MCHVVNVDDTCHPHPHPPFLTCRAQFSASWVWHLSSSPDSFRRASKEDLRGMYLKGATEVGWRCDGSVEEYERGKEVCGCGWGGWYVEPNHGGKQ